MPLHPDDVVRKTFRTTQLRRGYDEGEVDAFLQEVVVELRGLRGEVDEQKAEIDHLRGQLEHGDRGSQRRALEEQQLVQVRRERDSVVQELRDADRRVAQARADAEAAERDREASLEEIRARFDDDLFALEQKVHQVREEANRAEDESQARQRAAQDLMTQMQLEEEQLAGRLTALRGEALQALREELGADRADELAADIRIPEAAGPMADLRFVAALAAAARSEQSERAVRDAEAVRTQAVAERERMIGDATQRTQALLVNAQREHDELVEQAKSTHDELLRTAQDQHDELVSTAQAEHARLLNEAQSEHSRLLTEAQSEHGRLTGEGKAEHDRMIEAAKAQQMRFVADGSQTRDKLLAEGQAENQRLIRTAKDEHKRMIDEATEEHRRLLDTGKAEHDRLISEAEAERAGILADLNARRDLLQGNVDELDRFQGEYRQRLRTFMAEQMKVLDDEAWHR